jgi:hypothetical protein
LSQSIDYSIPTPSIHNLPQFERKIAYNDVKRYVWIIQQYGDFGSQLEEVYKTLNDEKPRIKQRIWNFIKTKYGKIKGELAQENPQQDIIEVVKQNADNIIDKVKQELEAGFYDSQMHIEDVEACLLTVIVDAFINCHILERPPES